MNKIPFVILNYNNSELTINLVSNIRKVEGKEHTIIVVDNNSQEDEKNKLSEIPKLFGEKVIFLEEKELAEYQNTSKLSEYGIIVILLENNYGYAKGNNFGLRLARKMGFKYCIISNNDIIIEKPVVSELIKILESYNDVAICGPKIIGIDGKEQGPFKKPGIKEYIIYPLIHPILSPFLKIRRTIIEKMSSKEEKTENISFPYRLMGFFLAVNLEVLERVDFFSEETFLYAEELILSEKLGKIGFKTAYNPKITVIHLHGETTKSLGFKKMYFLDLESNLIYLKNYRNYPNFLINIVKIAKTFYFYFWVPILSILENLKKIYKKYIKLKK